MSRTYVLVCFDCLNCFWSVFGRIFLLFASMASREKSRETSREEDGQGLDCSLSEMCIDGKLFCCYFGQKETVIYFSRFFHSYFSVNAQLNWHLCAPLRIGQVVKRLIHAECKYFRIYYLFQNILLGVCLRNRVLCRYFYTYRKETTWKA